ncbi:MAG TPA: peptide MFS transporter [Gammaproteobacteria bacterium]|nr:peptide MFS transporter [Gammaproteobacteria bacterium]
MSTPSATPDAGKQRQPRGLYTLFFTEMWERLSYYGMRGILVLALVDAVATGGLGLDAETATAIYGLYTAGVYLLALAGGWIADHVLGARRTVWWGGCIIALGHFTMAIPVNETTFFLGMLLIVLGTGLLKPNISAMVGDLYPEGGARRDAGFSIYYMGINIGAFIAPFVCGTLGEKVGWHWGFGAAGVGMVLGLIQYRLTQHHLGDIGLSPAPEKSGAERARTVRRGWTGLNVAIVVLAVIVFAIATGLIPFNPVQVARATTVIILALAVLFFASVYAFGHLDKQEKLHVGGIILFFIAAAIFWAGFEQAGSSFNLFAERFTDRMIFGWEMPASWLQSVNSVFIILLAPVFAAIWLRLGAKNLNPSLPMKLALGLIQMGLGFLVMFFAAELVLAGNQVLPTWLILTYLLHTTGELCLSPIGLSAVTKLAPRRFSGQMMGTWFMGAALGNLVAGLVAGNIIGDNAADMPTIFMKGTILGVGAGLLMIICIKPLNKLMGNVK